MRLADCKFAAPRNGWERFWLAENWLAVWLSEQVVLPLAYALVRRRWLPNRAWQWHWLSILCPPLAGALTWLSETGKASNQVLLYWDGTDTPTDMESVLTDVAEMIARAPSPLGVDDYRINVARLKALPGDEGGLTEARLDATLRQRKMGRCDTLEGNRYYDWKRGDGPAQALALITAAEPTPALPVTVVEVLCLGRAVAAVARCWQRNGEG